jgi:hypothetical protein
VDWQLDLRPITPAGNVSAGAAKPAVNGSEPDGATPRYVRDREVVKLLTELRVAVDDVHLAIGQINARLASVERAIREAAGPREDELGGAAARPLRDATSVREAPAARQELRRRRLRATGPRPLDDTVAGA